MDARNLLKPMLARGELHCIGATTLDEYRKHIEKDAALERRFQPVLVDEPTVEDTISILRGLQGALRGPPRRADHRLGARGRRDAVRPLHHRPLPARQGDRPGRRGGQPAADGDRLASRRARRAQAAADLQLEIERRGAAQGEGRGVKDRAGGSWRPSSARSREQAGAMKQRWETREGRIAGAASTKEEIERTQLRDRAGRSAKRDYRDGRAAAVRHAGRARSALEGPGGGARRADRRARRCSRRRSTPTTSRQSSPRGPASR